MFMQCRAGTSVRGICACVCMCLPRQGTVSAGGVSDPVRLSSKGPHLALKAAVHIGEPGGVICEERVQGRVVATGHKGSEGTVRTLQRRGRARGCRQSTKGVRKPNCREVQSALLHTCDAAGHNRLPFVLDQPKLATCRRLAASHMCALASRVLTGRGLLGSDR